MEIDYGRESPSEPLESDQLEITVIVESIAGTTQRP
jgi:hypothetical protein